MPIDQHVDLGSWHLVGDGLVPEEMDVRYDVIWRSVTAGDTIVATFTHHFLPGPSYNIAVQYEDDADGTVAIDPQPGDQLVLRFTALTGSLTWFPNGDGANKGGRIPSLTFP
jgi:hypothetical protein